LQNKKKLRDKGSQLRRKPRDTDMKKRKERGRSTKQSKRDSELRPRKKPKDKE
jgi:hypothetical protein